MPPISPEAPDYKNLIGQTLDGRYLIENVLGIGGMGVVFLGKHITIDKPVAIKVLRREVGTHSELVKRFMQEARAVSRIGHPNIVDVTDFGDTPDGLTYQVMELLRGQTLGNKLRMEGRLSLGQTMAVLEQVGRALAAAHDKGVIHRDIKPDNVFLLPRHGRSDFVKLMDFGVAKVNPRNKESGAIRTDVGLIFGTPEYMAPEQASGYSQVDARADQYSLAILTVEMLCGRVPFCGASPVETVAMQLCDPLPPLGSLNPDVTISLHLEQILTRALAKKPESRYMTVTEFVEDCLRVAGARPRPLSGPTSELVLAAEPPLTLSQAMPRLAGDPPNIRRAGVAERLPTDLMGQRKRRSVARTLLITLAALLCGAAAGVSLWLGMTNSRQDGGQNGITADGSSSLEAAATNPEPFPAQVPLALPAVANPEPGNPEPAKPLAPPDAGAVLDPGSVRVSLTAIPAQATFSIDGKNMGRGPLVFDRPKDSILRYQCFAQGFHSREKRVRLRGTQNLLCEVPVKSRTKCVAGLKNPFEPCPE